MAEVANHIFLPYVQPGVAEHIADSSIDTLAADQPSVITMQVRLVVNTDTVDKTLRLYGPGDVTGIDPHQVVRTEPRPGTTEFEPNYFAAIEFDRPDFPWLFTPAKADAQGRLRPWICLVVVRRQPGVELRPPGAQPLPTLNILAPAKPGDELPDLSESWAWAHTQLTGTDKTQIKQALESDPARNASRLLCPRRLDPGTEYLACVVPTFEVGRKAGLGLPIPAAEELKLAPAWPSGAQAPAQVTLPVYYSWEFRTGAGGDFEELVRRLQPRQLPPEVGRRPMDIAHPGFTMSPPPDASTPGAVLGLEGALRVLATQPDDWSAATRLPFQNGLLPILNTPWQLATKPGATGDPVVAPPVYGCWHAAAHDISNAPPPAPAPPWPPTFWLNELNLDPRHRVAAGLGTQVVQSQQEQLMASAWAQLGDIQKINQRKRQAQLSRAVNDRIHAKTFSRFSEETLLKVVAPAQSRVLLEERPPNQPAAPPVITPLIGKIGTSVVPSSVVSAPMRKLLRPRGAINRQFAQAQATGAVAMIAFFNTPTPPASVVPDRGGVTIDKISDALPITDPLRARIRFSAVTPAAIAARSPVPSTLVAFRDPAIAHQQYLTLLFMTFIFFQFRKLIDAPGVKTLALASINPAKTVADAVAASIRVGSPALQTGDPLDPVMDAPTFPQPMYEALRDLSQDYLLPGLEYVPPNTVQLLQTNAKFIESFMVGLNTEMGRELLWRDYPTDQRGTYFQQFWDTAAAGSASTVDIIPIHQWGTRALGTTAVGAGGDKVVLLVRGELLRRYPSTVIYAVRAIMQAGKRTLSPNPLDEAHPVFRGTLEPDVTFLGFNLTPAEVIATPGWFFVLQQQPTEPRFGMDDDPFGAGESGVIPELRTWSDLNWAHVAPSPAALKALAYVSLKQITLTPTTPQQATWGRNSAHMAYITKQLPVRVAIHASEMIPSPVSLPK
jgi:hypothetical protein